VPPAGGNCWLIPGRGNVRELSHELERAIVFEETDELDFAGLRTTAGSDKLCQADPKDWLNPQFSLPSEGFSVDAATDRFIKWR